ncbi:Uma2 family endonuclease [Dactylosporangium sp. NPDC050688]|uniref:Uma2 family endonuclease n=1 Tax=Dactylosporangium sp. NPDC050688 TaxID=3157217 RepID=UPI0033E4473A
MGEGLAAAFGAVELCSHGRLLLVVEVVSTDSEVVDRIIKKAGYAEAGISRYWFVKCDGGTAHRRALHPETGEYEPGPGGDQPLSWLLTAVPDLL